ncbi:Polyribonucleotide nucleotidyltransferase [Bienertia sinuspersici]
MSQLVICSSVVKSLEESRAARKEEAQIQHEPSWLPLYGQYGPIETTSFSGRRLSTHMRSSMWQTLNWIDGKADSEVKDKRIGCRIWEKGEVPVQLNGSIAACGWVFNQGSHTTWAGSKKIFTLSPVKAEAQSLQIGATIARAEVDVIQIFTDSERLIQMLGNPKSAPVEYVHILSDILCVLKRFSFCRICKVSRSHVKEAHNLAVQARREPA